MICGLSCGFVGRGSGRLLGCRTPVLTVADHRIWHGCGTNLSRRQSATMVGVSARRLRSWRSATSWLAAAVNRQHDQKVASKPTTSRWLPVEHS